MHALSNIEVVHAMNACIHAQQNDISYTKRRLEHTQKNKTQYSLTPSLTPLASVRPPPLRAYLPMPSPPVRIPARLRAVELRKAPPTPQQLHPRIIAHLDAPRIGTLLMLGLMLFDHFLLVFADTLHKNKQWRYAHAGTTSARRNTHTLISARDICGPTMASATLTITSSADLPSRRSTQTVPCGRWMI